MTTAELLSEMVSRGVEFQAHGDMLRFRPADALRPADVDNIRRHKRQLLALLRAEGLAYRHPAADPRPLEGCDRCGATNYIDVVVHNGQSLRRDCACCHRFLGWPRWYGRSIDPCCGENRRDERHTE